VKKSFHLKSKTSNMVWGYFFVFPALLFLTVFMLTPIAQIFYYSLTDWSGGFDASFIGFQNYRDIFNNPEFYTVLGNNLFILSIGVPMWTIFPLLIAALMYERVKGYKFFKSAYFFPNVLSIVVVGTLFRTLFGYMGPINEFLRLIGHDNLAREWLAYGSTSLPIIVLAVNWAGFGAAMLIYLAGMSNIDGAIYEAAKIDGVTWWQNFRYITLPMIKNVIEFTIVLNIIFAFSQMFPFVLVMTGGGPGFESTVLEYFVFLRGFRMGEMGYASALAVIIFLLVFAITIARTLLIRKGDD
jgi:ABC-type sugar transport system permease subunit